MTLKEYLSLPELRISNLSTRSGIPGGDIARPSRLLRFLGDLGRLVKDIAVQKLVRLNLVVRHSDVRPEWLGRAGIHTRIIARIYVEGRGIYFARAVEGAAALSTIQGLHAIDDGRLGAILVLSALLCPRTPIHRSIATLRGLRDYSGSCGYSKAAREAAEQDMVWVCSFTPCSYSLDMDLLTPLSKRAFYKSGAIRTVYALNTLLYPVFLPNLAALYIVTLKSVEPIVAYRDRGIVKYRRSVWGDSIVVDRIERLLETSIDDAAGAVDEAASMLPRVQGDVLKALHNVLCSS